MFTGKKLTDLWANDIKERSDFWYVFRGIAICFIVIGHSHYFLSSKEFFFFFHVPLFYFLSGLFYKLSTNYKENIGSKICSLWVPFVLYGILLVLLHNRLLVCEIPGIAAGIYSTKNKLTYVGDTLAFRIVEHPHTAAWFLVSLFIGVLLYDAIKHFASRIKKRFRNTILWGLLISLAFISSILLGMNIILPYYISTVLLILPIIGFGDLFKQIESKVKISYILGAISILGLFVAANYFDIIIDLRGAIYSNMLILYLMSILGVYLTLVLTRLFVKPKLLKSFFVVLGKNSLHIMLMHILVMNIFDKLWIYMGLKTTSLDIWFAPYLSVLLGLIIPVLLIEMIRVSRRYAHLFFKQTLYE